MQNDISGFGVNIQKRREQLGLTQTQLAERIWEEEIKSSDNEPSAVKEQKRKNIGNYENGKFPKDGGIYYRLCKVLDCDMDYLFGLIDSPKHVLESETFWQFLKLMETYKSVGTTGDNVGEYVNKRIESAAKTLLPEPMREDMDIFNDGFYQTICARYCWLLMEEYKKSGDISPAK